MIKRLLTFAVACAISALSIMAVQLTDESLNYRVMFKWGLINKHAGDATLSLKTSGDTYRTRMTARSASWADKFYTLRDTLSGVIRRDGFKPLRYENISHEGGDYKHDIVTYDYSTAGAVKASAIHNWRKKKETAVSRKDQTFEATGTAMDMLSVFYYMRSLDFYKMKVNDTKKIYIFSGKRKELLTIKYAGTQRIDVDDKAYSCYHITFTFTSDGGKKTSDDMDAWISVDTRRIPIKLEGKLPVGKVHCLYVGK